MESSPMLVNHPRVAANAVLSPPEEADSPAAHPRPRQGPANKQLDFDLSDDELNVSSSDTKSAPKLLAFDDSDIEDDDACNVTSTSTPSKPPPSTSTCSTPTSQQLASLKPERPVKKPSPRLADRPAPEDADTTPRLRSPTKKAVVFSTPAKAQRPPTPKLDHRSSSGSKLHTPRITPAGQKIACEKQRTEPPKVRRKWEVEAGNDCNTDSPAKTRSGRIYVNRRLSPIKATPKSAPPLRRPHQNNLAFKLSLLQSDIVQPSSAVKKTLCKHRKQSESSSSSASSSDKENEKEKVRMEVVSSSPSQQQQQQVVPPPPELPEPKLTEPPKLMAKVKRPVSRIRRSDSPNTRRWEQFGDQCSTPVRGIIRRSPPSAAQGDNFNQCTPIRSFPRPTPAAATEGDESPLETSIHTAPIIRRVPSPLSLETSIHTAPPAIHDTPAAGPPPLPRRKVSRPSVLLETSIHEAHAPPPPRRKMTNPSPPTSGLGKMRLDESPPMGFSPDSPRTLPSRRGPVPRTLLNFEGEDGACTRRSSLPSMLPSQQRKRKCANINPFTPTPSIDSIKKRKISSQSPQNESTPPDNKLDDAAIAAKGMATPSNGVGRAFMDESVVESPNAAPGKRIRVTDINISRYTQEFIELDELACGQYGRVSACRHRLDGMVYAIKSSKEQIRGQSFEERAAMNEIFAHSALIKHRHVVRYYNSWVENGRVYIQNEFCEGGSLAAKIAELRKNNLRFSEYDLKKIILQVLKGLQYIHSKNLVHLDIKPENIFISEMETLSANSSPDRLNSDPEVAAAILAENVAAELAAAEARKAGATAFAAACEKTVVRPVVYSSAAAADTTVDKKGEESDDKKQDGGDNTDPEKKRLLSTDSGNHSDIPFPDHMIHKMADNVCYKVGDLGHVVSAEAREASQPEEGDSRYMAPELMEPSVNKLHLFKSDVFSLGLSIYEAASLIDIPKNSSENAHYSNFRQGNLPFIDGYSKDINAVIKMMCSPEPSHRPSVARMISIVSSPLSPSNMKVKKTRIELKQEVNEIRARLRALEAELRSAEVEGGKQQDDNQPQPMEVQPITPPSSKGPTMAKAPSTCSMTLRKRVIKATPPNVTGCCLTPRVSTRKVSLRKKALLNEAKAL